MCWMQFDDYMDDLADDLQECDREIERITAELRRLGADVPSPPARGGGPSGAGWDMNRAAGWKQGEVDEAHEHLARLKKLLEEWSTPLVRALHDPPPGAKPEAPEAQAEPKPKKTARKPASTPPKARGRSRKPRGR
jgi:hypothetical protein